MAIQNEITWDLSEERFGPLWPFIIDDQITDIDWDSDVLWLKYADGHRIAPDIEISKDFIDNFTQHIANHVSKSFNQMDSIVYADTNNLRITMGHEVFIKSGTSVFIRKTLPKLRFLAIQITKNGYCDEELLHFLINCVSAKSNFGICGEPGHGKTELAKFLSSFIKASDKVITIEDSREWYYRQINKGKRGLEFIVRNIEEYPDYIKFAVRCNPDWLMLSEARAKEARDLILAWSTGVKGMTTLHTNNVKYIPDRIANMISDSNITQTVVDEVYMYLDIGILVSESEDEYGNRRRHIKQVCVFHKENEENICQIIYEDGILYKDNIPEFLLKKMQSIGITDPFYSQVLIERMELEKDPKTLSDKIAIVGIDNSSYSYDKVR